MEDLFEELCVSNPCYIVRHLTQYFYFCFTCQVSQTLSNEVSILKANLKSALASAESVSVTVDIWSDRTCQGYPGITVHFIGDDKMTLRSQLLACQRFEESYTASIIQHRFDNKNAKGMT